MDIVCMVATICGTTDPLPVQGTRTCVSAKCPGSIQAVLEGRDKQVETTQVKLKTKVEVEDIPERLYILQQCTCNVSLNC